MSRPAERVVAFYNKRGTCEQWIKEGKGAIKWTRKGENLQHHRVDFGNRSRLKQVRSLAVAGAKRFPDELELPTVAEGGRIRYDVSSRYACRN